MNSTPLTPTARFPRARVPQAPGATTPATRASRLGGALHAVRVFATAAFGVAVLGDYDADAAGIRRR
ncbi:hypothetical protein [Streptomyces thermolilacinus]|uniref:Uncharacterized protein n=1 Tax=Streptomyces thermolilacinus SPC6 TaxID=1306406 RepID=A0A1D3DTL7_9ACTN|nr:hypothetical protein [Streptomyces thermolilacinus]OEJ95665.1 hypothetical protein J116_015405 [Streptomyces thermolilacinus SPC6]